LWPLRAAVVDAVAVGAVLDAAATAVIDVTRTPAVATARNAF